jgi:hypothetical protein
LPFLVVVVLIEFTKSFLVAEILKYGRNLSQSHHISEATYVPFSNMGPNFHTNSV